MPRDHKTGEYVPRNAGGRWRCPSGHEIALDGGDVFPPCPRCRAAVTWSYVG